MAVSIKDPDADRLIRELARRTGETQVSAVRTAVAERLARLDQEHSKPRHTRKERLRAITDDTGHRLASAPASTELGDLLYDDRGMPA